MLRFVLSLFFPPKCVACRKLLDWHLPFEDANDALCQNCADEWESETLETCGMCAKPVPACTCMTLAMSEAKCAGFSKTVYYHPTRRRLVQNRMIYHIKKRENDNVLRFCANALAISLLKMLEESGCIGDEVVLTYLPRSRRARLLNGTDQALALCRVLSDVTGIPYQSMLVRGRGEEQEQKRLSPAMRLQNAKRAILARRDVDCKGKTVVLVDDVVTTGASVSAGVRALRKMGAKQVFCAAIATDICNKDLITH